jgi:hypothetical protein
VRLYWTTLPERMGTLIESNLVSWKKLITEARLQLE